MVLRFKRKWKKPGLPKTAVERSPLPMWRRWHHGVDDQARSKNRLGRGDDLRLVTVKTRETAVLDIEITRIK